MADDGENWEHAATIAELDAAKNGLLAVSVGERDVLLVKIGDSVYALDSNCYHMGGNLATGDIEELPSGVCVVVCPYHHYKIAVEDGKGYYRGLDGSVKEKSGGPRQRTHATRLDDDGNILVSLSTEGTFASDEYACIDELLSRRGKTVSLGGGKGTVTYPPNFSG